MASFDEDEIPTKPWHALVPCPACNGEGGILHEIENAIGYRAVRKRCVVCQTKGAVTRIVAAKWERLLRDT